ncbi:DUF3618 domain-containing protein [Streptomyces sp. 4N509B]|uniref:DUF3618 domain-containing protein n=1 Tax=Streptomyces sp. 4N509B TaxID=3457413 RepID=UPI003FD58154
MAEAARTPEEIEARIARRRKDLAVTLDEIAVRVHPRTIMGDARARAMEVRDRTVERVTGGVRDQFVTPEGAVRLERVVPVALVAAAAVGLLVLSSRSSSRPSSRGCGRRRS